MVARLLQTAKELLTKIRRATGSDRRRIRGIYEEKGYLEAYSEHTDLRIESDPQAAVGGRWDEIGELQYEFLLHKGLRPESTLLDIGCGTLRGGRHFIRYLSPRNYYGLDISRAAIKFGKQLVQDEGLAGKAPHLIVSENKDLTFREFTEPGGRGGEDIRLQPCAVGLYPSDAGAYRRMLRPHRPNHAH